MITTAIRAIVMVVMLGVWTFLGFFLWIPYLVRVMSVYTAVLTVSMFREAPIGAAASAADKAQVFYIEGFRRIVSSLWTLDDSSFDIERVTTPSGQQMDIRRPQVAHLDRQTLIITGLHVFWSFAFWAVAYALIVL